MFIFKMHIYISIETVICPLLTLKDSSRIIKLWVYPKRYLTKDEIGAKTGKGFYIKTQIWVNYFIL
jgi:hypothetical protein